jgi:8-oxo-dGTP diphosphatase
MKLGTLCYLKDKDANKTLMIHRVKKINDMHEGKWNGLGGKIEPGETPEECVIREIKEESGLIINNPILKGLLTFPDFGGKNNNEDWYVFVFIADDFKGKLIDSNEGNLKWIDNEKLLELPLWGGDKIFLPWLEKKEFFSGKFTYKDGELIEHCVNFYPI